VTVTTLDSKAETAEAPLSKSIIKVQSVPEVPAIPNVNSLIAVYVILSFMILH
jgi:hypothetical protein